MSLETPAGIGFLPRRLKPGPRKATERSERKRSLANIKYSCLMNETRIMKLIQVGKSLIYSFKKHYFPSA